MKANMKPRVLLILATVLGSFTGVSVYAAGDGTLGTDSTGTTDLTLTIDDMVRISNLQDINLGTYSGTGTETGETGACIFRNGAGNYTVTATTNKGAFRLSSGTGGTASEDINFDAYWNDEDVEVAGRAALVYTTALTGQTGAHTTSITCSATDNANFSLEIAATEMQTKVPDTYVATVTLVIAPE